MPLTHSEQVIMDIKAVGLDIGKSWFHFVGCNRAGKPIAQHKFNRSQLMQFIASLAKRREQLERQRAEIDQVLAEIQAFEEQSKKLLSAKKRRGAG